ncbi:hypothetical protein QQS21_002861 [Conoideocrella luteorostrata]|uniref:PPM-type phosphatase domain-containing protein n=1 Tax=Conoideocrella luteorostrata TaxID=1105319 RepID=A0AAJ0CUE3_9HYPO|nr:hypothetical protein QQS21_002861 [Conoideocrella luteorostrata]
MFRKAATVGRLVISRRRMAPHATRRTVKAYSWSAQPPNKDSPAIVALTFAALVAGASGCYYVSQSDQPAGAVPRISDFASEKDVPVESPVKVFNLKEANAKLREQASTLLFDVKGGSRGRVDVVRLSSNNPVEDEWAVAVGKGVGGNETLYAGIYDGHAGWATSAVLRRALIPYVSCAVGRVAASAEGELIESAIKSAFNNLDTRIMNDAQRAADSDKEPGSADVIAAVAPSVSGSCALLSMYDPVLSVVRTAVTGDSRAVLGSWSSEVGKYAAEALSKDQTGFNQDEVDRLDKAHPGEIGDIVDTKSGRLLGIAITRAFGDNRWKWTEDALKSLQANYHGLEPRPRYKTPPYMTAEPEVTTRAVTTKDFVILASDGLWDVMSNDVAVACVSRWLAAKKMQKSEAVPDMKSSYAVGEDGWPSHKSSPEFFAIEDLDNAAVCLVKNALGGARRAMFCGAITAYAPISRYVRDDMTVQVVFFHNPDDSTK